MSIHEVRVSNIILSTTRAQVSGLLPGTAYQCCVNAHIQTNPPLDLINSICVITTTKSEKPVTIINKSFQDLNGLIIGLGVGLGICSLLLLVSILVGFKVSKIMSCTNCLKRDSTTQGNIKRCDQYLINTFFPIAVNKPCSIILSIFYNKYNIESLKSMTWWPTPFIISPCNALHNKG